MKQITDDEARRLLENFKGPVKHYFPGYARAPEPEKTEKAEFKCPNCQRRRKVPYDFFEKSSRKSLYCFGCNHKFS